jgi:hypothetical protein
MRWLWQSRGRDHATRVANVDAAERPFRQMGFHKTSVAGVGQHLQMSPAIVQEALERRLLNEIEESVDDIARSSGPASAKLRDFIVAIEEVNTRRSQDSPELQELVETTFNEKWRIAYQRRRKIVTSLTAIISQGKRDGEFHIKESDDAAILVYSACLRFCHPRLSSEYAQEPEPLIDDVVDFCLAALQWGDLPRSPASGQSMSKSLRPYSSNGAPFSTACPSGIAIGERLWAMQVQMWLKWWYGCLVSSSSQRSS